MVKCAAAASASVHAVCCVPRLVQIPFALTWQQLKDEFSTVGKVLRAEIESHADTGRSKGFAIVTFDSAESAARAVGTDT